MVSAESGSLASSGRIDDDSAAFERSIYGFARYFRNTSIFPAASSTVEIGPLFRINRLFRISTYPPGLNPSAIVPIRQDVLAARGNSLSRATLNPHSRYTADARF
jgi:hypothetical protein